MPFLGVYTHKRKAATHILVVMISHEQCNVKPYALPVQLIAYCGMTKVALRKVVNNVIQEMTNIGMNVQGKVYINLYNLYNYNIKCI